MPRRTRNQQSYAIEEIHLYNILYDDREVFLHGYVDNTENDPGVEYRSTNKFIKNLRFLEAASNTKPIVVHQHSIGGEVQDGFAMYDAIKSCQAPVIFICHGVAASMGSIIPQAADLRIIMPHCQFLVHDGDTGLNPNLTVRQARKWAEWEQIQTNWMIDAYVKNCVEGEYFKKLRMSSDQVSEYILSQLNDKEDWILDAEQAVYYGFMDGIYGDENHPNLEAVKAEYV